MSVLKPTPEGIAAAWKAWREVVGPQAHLGPGPAFKEALKAAYAVDASPIIAAVREECAKDAERLAQIFARDGKDNEAVGAETAAAAIRSQT